jgi:methyl-accepting chemotaxis protein
MRNWSFNKKVLLVGLIFAATSLGIAMLGVLGLSRLERTLDLYDTGFDVEWAVDAIERAPLEIRGLEAGAILETYTESVGVYPKRIADLYNDWDSSISTLALKSNSVARKEQLEELRKLLGKRKEVSEKVLKLALEGDSESAFSVHNPDEEPTKSLEEKIDKIVADVSAGERAALSGFRREATSQGKTWIYWMSLISLVGFGAGMLLANGIMITMNKSLNRVAENLFDSANQLMGASHQIAVSSTHLSHSAATQASSLEETAASMEEITSMVGVTAANARKTSEVAVSSLEQAQKGKAVVENMTQAMDDINRSNNDIMLQISASNQQIEEIIKVIAEIGDKTKVINDIVFQTKLLSFNASVEAARAGEHGKGFAVVAEEVGNLAQMSGNASKEISAMLDNSLHKVERIVDETQQKVEKLIAVGRVKVETGSAIAAQCSVVLTDLVANFANVSRMANEISEASSAQSVNIAEINRTMAQLEQITQKEATSSEGYAAAAEELSAQAESLRGIVRNLMTVVKGGPVSGGRARRLNEDEERGTDGLEQLELQPPQAIAEKPRLHAVQGKNAKPTKRSRPTQARRSGEEILRKAAGAEDIPLDIDPRFHEN